MDNLDPEKQERVKNAHDIQLDRATDLLKGMLLFRDRSQYTRKTGGDTRTAARMAGKE